MYSSGLQVDLTNVEQGCWNAYYSVTRKKDTGHHVTSRRNLRKMYPKYEQGIFAGMKKVFDMIGKKN